MLIKFLSVLAKSFPFKIVTILAENQLVGLYSVTDRDIIEKLFCSKYGYQVSEEFLSCYFCFGFFGLVCFFVCLV